MSGEIVQESVDWMQPSRDKDQWRAYVYTEVNLRVPKRRWISWI